MEMKLNSINTYHMHAFDCSGECATDTDFFVDVFKVTPCNSNKNMMTLIFSYVNFKEIANVSCCH